MHWSTETVKWSGSKKGHQDDGKNVASPSRMRSPQSRSVGPLTQAVLDRSKMKASTEQRMPMVRNMSPRRSRPPGDRMNLSKARVQSVGMSGIHSPPSGSNVVAATKALGIESNLMHKSPSAVSSPPAKLGKGASPSMSGRMQSSVVSSKTVSSDQVNRCSPGVTSPHPVLAEQDSRLSPARGTTTVTSPQHVADDEVICLSPCKNYSENVTSTSVNHRSLSAEGSRPSQEQTPTELSSSVVSSDGSNTPQCSVQSSVSVSEDQSTCNVSQVMSQLQSPDHSVSTSSPHNTSVAMCSIAQEVDSSNVDITSDLTDNSSTEASLKSIPSPPPVISEQSNGLPDAVVDSKPQNTETSNDTPRAVMSSVNALTSGGDSGIDMTSPVNRITSSTVTDTVTTELSDTSITTSQTGGGSGSDLVSGTNRSSSDSTFEGMETDANESISVSKDKESSAQINVGSEAAAPVGTETGCDNVEGQMEDDTPEMLFYAVPVSHTSMPHQKAQISHHKVPVSWHQGPVLRQQVPRQLTTSMVRQPVPTLRPNMPGQTKKLHHPGPWKTVRLNPTSQTMPPRSGAPSRPVTTRMPAVPSSGKSRPSMSWHSSVKLPVPSFDAPQNMGAGTNTLGPRFTSQIRHSIGTGNRSLVGQGPRMQTGVLKRTGLDGSDPEHKGDWQGRRGPRKPGDPPTDGSEDQDESGNDRTAARGPLHRMPTHPRMGGQRKWSGDANRKVAAGMARESEEDMEDGEDGLYDHESEFSEMSSEYSESMGSEEESYDEDEDAYIRNQYMMQRMGMATDENMDLATPQLHHLGKNTGVLEPGEIPDIPPTSRSEPVIDVSSPSPTRTEDTRTNSLAPTTVVENVDLTSDGPGEDAVEESAEDNTSQHPRGSWKDATFPEVILSKKCMVALNANTELTDPYCSKCMPPRQQIHAIRQVAASVRQKKSCDVLYVDLDYGLFALNALDVFEEFHDMLEIKNQVEEEIDWFKEFYYAQQRCEKRIDHKHITSFQQLLHANRPNTLFHLNGMDMRVSDLVDLTCERWLNDNIMHNFASLVNKTIDNHRSYVIYFNHFLNMKRLADKVKKKFDNNFEGAQLLFILHVGYAGGNAFVGERIVDGIQQQANHFSMAVLNLGNSQIIYADSKGWPFPKGLWDQVNSLLSHLSRPPITKLRQAHNPMSYNRDEFTNDIQHVCSDSCARLYPLQQCASVCGVAVVVGFCIAALDRQMYSLLTNQTLGQDAYKLGYLLDISDHSHFLRLILIDWLMSGEIDLKLLYRKKRRKPVALVTNLKPRKQVNLPFWVPHTQFGHSKSVVGRIGQVRFSHLKPLRKKRPKRTLNVESIQHMLSEPAEVRFLRKSNRIRLACHLRGAGKSKKLVIKSFKRTPHDSDEKALRTLQEFINSPKCLQWLQSHSTPLPLGQDITGLLVGPPQIIYVKSKNSFRLKCIMKSGQTRYRYFNCSLERKQDVFARDTVSVFVESPEYKEWLLGIFNSDTDWENVDSVPVGKDTSLYFQELVPFQVSKKYSVNDTYVSVEHDKDSKDSVDLSQGHSLNDTYKLKGVAYEDGMDEEAWAATILVKCQSHGTECRSDCGMPLTKLNPAFSHQVCPGCGATLQNFQFCLRDSPASGAHPGRSQQGTKTILYSRHLLCKWKMKLVLSTTDMGQWKVYKHKDNFCYHTKLDTQEELAHELQERFHKKVQEGSGQRGTGRFPHGMVPQRFMHTNRPEMMGRGAQIKNIGPSSGANFVRGAQPGPRPDIRPENFARGANFGIRSQGFARGFDLQNSARGMKPQDFGRGMRPQNFARGGSSEHGNFAPGSHHGNFPRGIRPGNLPPGHKQGFQAGNMMGHLGKLMDMDSGVQNNMQMIKDEYSDYSDMDYSDEEVLEDEEMFDEPMVQMPKQKAKVAAKKKGGLPDTVMCGKCLDEERNILYSCKSKNALNIHITEEHVPSPIVCAICYSEAGRIVRFRVEKDFKEHQQLEHPDSLKKKAPVRKKGKATPEKLQIQMEAGPLNAEPLM